MQEFQPFPTYDGFVMADPEGRWIEIMEYTDDTFRVQEFTNQPSGACGLQMIGFEETVTDLDAMTNWYKQAMAHQQVWSARSNGKGSVYLSDAHYDASTRNTLMMLTTANTDRQRAAVDRHGPHISALVYQAKDVQKAYDDAVWAGMKPVEPPATDPLTGALTARLVEPSGNDIVVREIFRP